MIRAGFKLFLMLLWTLYWFPPVWLAHFNHKHLRDKWGATYSRGLVRIIGVNTILSGAPSATRPLLVVSNHLSYLDVPIVAGYMTARFTPKKEIGDWPVIGTICRMMGCVFIDRRSAGVREAGGSMRKAMEDGQAVQLFPEGTTGHGIHLLPFKSSFFSTAELPVNGKAIAVQPVAVTYTRIGRLPIDSTQWPKIAWIGDSYLGPHFWNLLQLGPIEAKVSFLPTLTIDEAGGDRKKLAALCQQRITEEIERLKAEK